MQKNLKMEFKKTDKIWHISSLRLFNKTSLNYGADTNLSFIITYEIPRLYLNEFNRKYPRRLQKRILKNGFRIKKL